MGKSSQAMLKQTMKKGMSNSGLRRTESPTHHSLQVIPWISLSRFHIIPHISPESQHEIDNNRGAHRQQRGIDKIEPDTAGSNSHTVTDGRTNTKGIPLHKTFEFVHTINLKNHLQHPNSFPKKDCFTVNSLHFSGLKFEVYGSMLRTPCNFKHQIDKPQIRLQWYSTSTSSRNYTLECRPK